MQRPETLADFPCAMSSEEQRETPRPRFLPRERRPRSHPSFAWSPELRYDVESLQHWLDLNA